MSALTRTRRTEVLRQSWTVGVATGMYGISFGALSVASGLNVWQTQALSALMFTGGSQFAFVGVIGAGGLAAAPAAIATAALLGIRNGLYALQVSQLVPVRGLRRLVGAQLTIDESTAVGIAQPEPEAQRIGFWHTGFGVFVFWNLLTLAGALLGNALGDPKTWGLDAAAAGAFVALLWPRLATAEARRTAALAAVIAMAASPFTPPGMPVILTVVAAVVVGLLPHGRHEKPLGVDPPGSDPLP